MFLVFIVFSLFFLVKKGPHKKAQKNERASVTVSGACGHGEDVVKPRITQKMDWEALLAR